MATKYTWDDLHDDIKERVTDAEKGLALIKQGIALITDNKSWIAEREEIAAMYAGKKAAESVLNRQAARALSSLRTNVKEANEVSKES